MSTTKKTLGIFWQHAKKYPKSLAAISLVMPVFMFIEEFFVPILVSGMLSKLAKTEGQIDLSEFYVPLAVILVLELGLNFLWRPYVKVVWRFEENVMRDLYRTAFSHLMKMSYRFYANRFAGSIVSQINKFAYAFERLTDIMIWNIYKLVLAVLFTVAVLIKPAPMYVLVVLLFSALFIAILIRVKRNEHPYNKRWASAETKRTGQIADSISNILAVKAFANEQVETKLLKKTADHVHKRSMETMHRVMRNEAYTATSQRAINVAAIFISLLLASELSIEIGVVYLALTYTMGIMRRLWDLNNVMRNLSRIFGDSYDMTEILDIPPEVADAKNAKTLAHGRGDIVFDNVTFAHSDARGNLFHKFNLHIKPGEKIGLVGHSGSGKTTLTNLLLRFSDIQTGQIRIDTHDISAVTQDSLRKVISYVPQEPQMFHRSITENIRYGELDASDEAVTAAAKMANAHEFITQLGEGYDTLVGERGVKLSGGQRQRIAIARAMIKNAPILILDEATSALDSESEGLIQDALWRLMEGRTAIVIAHRLSTIQKMDRIIVMDDGKIVEQGSHRELIQQNGAYAKLWAKQSGGFMEE